MRRPARHVPALASDLVRSWISVTIAFGVGAGALATLVLVFGDDRSALATSITTLLYSWWSLFSLSYIALTVAAFVPLSHDGLMQALRGSRSPRGFWRRLWWSLNGGGAITWALTGSGFTLVTLVSLALSSDAVEPPLVWSGVVVVLSSAALIVTAFAVHYARTSAVRGGFDFPGTAPARFEDFLYLAGQISTSFGGGDVTATGSNARRSVAIHGAIAWLYNTVLVALLVSVLLRVSR